jgi:FkbM family methyltransferase
MGRLRALREVATLHAERAMRVLSGKEKVYSPEVSCPKVRLGSTYGGWTICPDGLNSDSVVYSVGLGNDITFDRAIIENYGTQVFGFDPTPSSLTYLANQSLPPQFHYYPYAVAAEDGDFSFFPPPQEGHVSYSFLQRETEQEKAITVPARRISTLMQELGHDHLDILKMDVEGAEYEILEDILSSKLRPKQLMVEFHHRFPSVGFAKTQHAVESLQGVGYRIFNVGQAGLDFSFFDQRTL